MTSNKLDPAEVLAYLNELGYYNITAIQLKEFMKDLKKLMKYESKQKKVDTEITKVPCTPCNYNWHPIPAMHLSRIESSKAKQVKKKDVISVEIKKKSVPVCAAYQQAQLETQNVPRKQVTDKISSHRPAQFVGKSKAESTNEATNDKKSKLDTRVVEVISTESSIKTQSTSPRRPKSCDSDSCKAKSKVTFKENVLKPKASFIIPRGPFKPHKSDPVALYHRYQKVWKKIKLPGEDNHNQLRWAIRERLLGQTPYTMSAAPSMEQIARRRVDVERL